MDTTYFDIYFYNGFEPPRRLARSLEEFEESNSITSNRLALGDIEEDVTDDSIEQLRAYKDGEIRKEEIGHGLVVNPTLDDFIQMNRQWFDGRNLLTYLDEWIDNRVSFSDMERDVMAELDTFPVTEGDIKEHADQWGYIYIEELESYVKGKDRLSVGG